MPSLGMFVTGEVKGLARPRATTFRGHARMYDPSQNVNEKGRIQVHFLETVKKLGIALPIVCDGKGFFVRIDAYFKVPKSFSKKKRMAALDGEILPTKKPDADNVCKLVLDSISGYLGDDAMVTRVIVEKHYGDVEGIDLLVCWEEPKND